MARNAAFFFQLGFEHGFSPCTRSRGMSYPRSRSYSKGWKAGVQFAERVLELAPTVTRSEYNLKAGTCTVSFQYVGLPALKPRKPRKDRKVAVSANEEE